jgi:cytidylate kinase
MPAGDPEYVEIRETMVRRDRIDSSREVAPLRPARGAVIVDTTEMTIQQVMDRILELVRDGEKGKCGRGV